jgi:hypothetical protein
MSEINDAARTAFRITTRTLASPAAPFYDGFVGVQPSLSSSSANDMTSADLQKLVGQKPFVPLRMYVSDGTVHDIRSGELIWVGIGMAVLVVPLPDQGDADKPLIERTIHIDLRHIVKVETETAQPTP